MDTNTMTAYFGAPISVYTRAQAIADGTLVDVTKTAAEAGFTIPVALTAGVWADCVAWAEEDNERKGTLQDEAGRLWDVIWMARVAAGRSARTNRVLVELRRIPRQGHGVTPRRVIVEAVVGPGDNGEPVVTIQHRGED